MRKFLFLVIVFILVGCESSPENIIQDVNLDEFTSNRIEGCIDDCIDEEEELKDQLQIMIDSLEEYLIKNDLAQEGCLGDEVSRSCYEYLENHDWSVYLEQKRILTNLLEEDYELVEGGLQTTYTFDPCSGIRCPRTYTMTLYMNDTTIRIERGQFRSYASFPYMTGGINVIIYDYSDGLSYESYYLNPVDEENPRSGYNYIYRSDEYKLSLKCHLEEGQFDYREIDLQTKNESLLLYLYGVDDSNQYSQRYSVNDSLYFFSITENSSLYTVESEDLHIRQLNGGNYIVKVNALLYKEWDSVKRAKSPDHDTEYFYLHNDDQMIAEINGYEVSLYKNEDSIEMYFIIKSYQINPFIEMFDQEFDVDSDNTLSSLYEDYIKFKEDPESFIPDELVVNDFDEEFFIEFFGLDLKTD